MLCIMFSVCDQIKAAPQPGDPCRPSIQDLVYLCLLSEYYQPFKRRIKSHLPFATVAYRGGVWGVQHPNTRNS